MKIGIYMWHAKGDAKYCIGEWNPSKKAYTGLSDFEAAKKRIEQEIKAKAGVKQYTFNDIDIDYYNVFDFYSSDNRTSHFDKLIHANLVKFFGSSCQVATEIFELEDKWKNHKNIFIDAIEKTAKNEWDKFDPARPFNYSPRVGSQDEAIKAVHEAINRNVEKFLLGCKCRFGKTFTAYEIMLQEKFDTALIMTFRPGDTKDAWLADLNSHQHFKDYQFFNQDNIEGFQNFTGKKVLFMSFQKAKVSDDFETIKSLDFDMLIIDEDQIGAHRIENRDLIKEVDKRFALVLTGTPELELISNEFGEDYYKFDYVDEQKLKKAGYKEYADMPELQLYSFDVSKKFAETITDRNGFTLSELFAVEDEKFKYPKSVNKFLDCISSTCESGNEDPEDDFGIFVNPDFNLNHGLWKLPSIKACKLLKELLNKHTFFNNYEVEVLPESDKSPKEIEKTCKEHKKTIWLTVMKNTVGVTVKHWTYTISLYGSDSSSLTSYIQFIFRAGSPGKSTFYSFDFCPSRVLDVVDSFAVARAKDKSNGQYEKALKEVLNFLQVYSYKGSGHFSKLDSNELFKQIADFKTYRSCRNLLAKDFEILEEFSEELKDVEIDATNPTVAKNEILKKLKKELEKKPKSKNKKSDEKDISQKDFAEKMFQAFCDIYSWVKYDKGVDDIEDFIKKLNSYRSNYEDYFDFSKDFMISFTALVNSSKKNFGIAIERFKSLPYKFALEDVPEELASRMLEKFSKRDDVCDGYCRGPSILKMAKKMGFKKLYAYIPEEEEKKARLIRILEKELGDCVNIIMDYKMMNIIMNPPYDGSLHLKILNKVLQECPKAEIVNLSPNFYENYKKLDNAPIASSIEVIDRNVASQLFGGCQFSFNLAIQHYGETKDKGLLTRYIPESYKVFSKIILKKTFKDVFVADYNEKGVFVPLKLMTSTWDKNKDFIVDKLGVLVDGKTLDGVYYKHRRNKNVDRWCGGIYFDTVEEAKNFVDFTETKFFITWVKAFHTNTRYILNEYPFMPTYTHPWTDEQLYKYFNLTSQEIKVIEEEV